MRQEVDPIVARQPRLGVEGGRDLVTAAISMPTTAGLSARGSPFEFGLRTIPLIPFLPILWRLTSRGRA